MFVVVLSHLVSSCISLMLYRPWADGKTLIAEVFVSKYDFDWGVGGE